MTNQNNQLTRIEKLLEELLTIQRESTSEAVLERVDRKTEQTIAVREQIEVVEEIMSALGLVDPTFSLFQLLAGENFDGLTASVKSQWYLAVLKLAVDNEKDMTRMNKLMEGETTPLTLMAMRNLLMKHFEHLID